MLDEELEYASVLLTELLHIVRPSLDRSRAYPIVYDMLDEGLTETNLDEYGQMLRAVCLKNSDDKKIH